MNKLPTELIQYINDKLDFFDQLNFNSTSRGLYYCIKIQPVPYIFLFEMYESFGNENCTYDWMGPIDCCRLDKSPCGYDAYLGHKYGGGDYGACILYQNKSIHTLPNISEFSYFGENCNLMYKFGEGDYGVCIVNQTKFTRNQPPPNVSDFKYFDFDFDTCIYKGINNKTEDSEYYVHATFMFSYSGHEHNVTSVHYEDGSDEIFNQKNFIQKCIDKVNRKNE